MPRYSVSRHPSVYDLNIKNWQIVLETNINNTSVGTMGTDLHGVVLRFNEATIDDAK
jgi:hypothetical protein